MDGHEADLQAPVVSRPGIATATNAPVLVAVDFSEEAAAALAWACDYAGSIGAPLEILHVVHDPADSPGAYRPDGNDQLEPMADVATRKLDQFVDEIGRADGSLRNLQDAKLLCVVGLPAPTILEVARAHRVGLLVLGSQHRRGIARLVHGSTAQQVAGRATVPVTIVKSGD